MAGAAGREEARVGRDSVRSGDGVAAIAGPDSSYGGGERRQGIGVRGHERHTESNGRQKDQQYDDRVVFPHSHSPPPFPTSPRLGGQRLASSDCGSPVGPPSYSRTRPPSENSTNRRPTDPATSAC